MPVIETLPFILFIVVIATSIAERINVPYPILLVIAGVLTGLIPGIPNWQPPSNIVLTLFLPPILFSAARSISWHDTKNNLGAVFSLSVVLVIITTFVLATILHTAFPPLSFESALVLGAIVSPTDAIAASSILNNMNVRNSLVRSLEVESLFNDATGISLYKMAVLFVFINSIDLVATTKMMILTGFGGIIIGLVFAYFTHLIVEQFLRDSENELPIIMSLVLAYVSYLFAEQFGASGILAVVTAGLFHKRTERITVPNIRLSESSVWRSLVFFLNGLIFITIGNQFPFYLNKVSYIPFGRLIYLAVLTIIGLIGLRLLWITISAFFSDKINKWSGQYNPESRQFSPQYIFITSWSGLRGMISLALAIALPMQITATHPFPSLNLIVFLTIIVILFTLFVQGLTLPYLIRVLKANRDSKSELKQIEMIYKRLTEQAIKNMDKLKENNEEKASPQAHKLVENYYTNRLLQFTIKLESNQNAPEIIHEAKQLLSGILESERKALTELRENNEISEEVYIRILRKLDRDEVGFSSYH